MNGIKINNLKVNLILFLIIISYVVGFFLNEDGSGSGRYDYFNYLVVTQESLTKHLVNPKAREAKAVLLRRLPRSLLQLL